MENIAHMQNVQSSDSLYENCPNQMLREKWSLLFVLKNLLVNILVILKFHHQTQCRCQVLKECLLVRDDGLVLQTGQDSDFIQSVFFLFVW